MGEMTSEQGLRLRVMQTSARTCCMESLQQAGLGRCVQVALSREEMHRATKPSCHCFANTQSPPNMKGEKDELTIWLPTVRCCAWKGASEVIIFSGSIVSETNSSLVRECPAQESKYWM